MSYCYCLGALGVLAVDLVGGFKSNNFNVKEFLLAFNQVIRDNKMSRGLA